MTRTKAAASTVVLMSAWILPDSASAFPVEAPPLPTERPAAAIHEVGWACGAYRCRIRTTQDNRAVGQRSFQEFLAQLVPYLNCCQASTVPFFGYSYGPEISFDYDHRTSIVSIIASEWQYNALPPTTDASAAQTVDHISSNSPY